MKHISESLLQILRLLSEEAADSKPNPNPKRLNSDEDW